MPFHVIKVKELPEGVSELVHELSAGWLAAALADVPGIAPGPGAGTVALEATRQGRRVLLRGNAAAPLAVTCVRCLAPFEMRVTAELDVLMRPGPGPLAASSAELGIEDLGEELYQGDEVVLDDMIRDLLLLEVPMNPSCGDSCPGWHRLTEAAAKE